MKVAKIGLGIALGVAGVLLSGPTGGASLALVGVGLNIVSRTLFPIKISRLSQNIRETVASALSDLPIIYGTTKVGLKLVEIRTGNANNKKLYIVGALCHGSQSGLGINAIQRIWFDEKLAFAADGTVQTAFKKGGTPYAAVTKYLGTEAQAADSTMTSEFPSQWTSLHRGRGIAYLVFELTYHPDIYQSIPSITVEVQGAKVLDPRQATPTYSYLSNPPLAALDYLLSPIYGLGSGRRVQLSAAAVSFSGLNGTSAANVVDGNPDTKGWDMAGGTASGDYAQFDFGRPIEIDRVDIWISRDSVPTETYLLQYADSAGGPYTTAYTAVLSLERRNTYRWASNNTGAHRYWRVKLNSSPSTGTWIMGVDFFATEIDYASFADEANTADQAVGIPPAESAYKIASASTAPNPLRLTITGHGWSTGDHVQVALALGFSSSNLEDALGPIEGRMYTITVVSGNIISLDGINASGTYVADSLRVGKLVTEAQYQTNGVLDTGQEPQENLKQILASGRGRLIYQGGKFRYHSRKTTSATISFTDADIRDIHFKVPGNQEKINRVRASFLNAEKDWAADQRDYPPPGYANSYLAEDNYFSSSIDLELPLVTGAYQADRINQVVLKESRDGISIDVTLGERGLLAQVGDVATITYDGAGWVAKPFWVEAIAGFTVEGEPVLSLMEYEPNAYVLSDAQLHSSLPNTNLPDASAAPDAPTGLTLTAADAELIPSPNGDWVPRIKVAWTPSVSPFRDYVQVQAKRHSDSTYVDAGTPLADDGLCYVSPVTIEQWDVQIRTVTTLGQASDWVQATITVAPISRPPARGVVEVFADFPGSPARWTSSGAGSETVITSGDAQYGGKLLRITAGRIHTWATQIPLDRGRLASIRWRWRRVRAGGTNDSFAIGLNCFNSKGEQLHATNGGVGTDVLYLFAPASVGLQTAWQELARYFRGWRGSWYGPAAGVLSQSGLGNYTAANVGDGNPSTKAFDVDSASSGAYLQVDLGSGNTKKFVGARLYLNAGSSTAQFKVQWSDDGSAFTDVVMRGGGATWTPSTDGWNEMDWTAPAAAHRYWRLALNNTPGAGPDIYEFALLDLLAQSGSETDPLNPLQLPPGTSFIQPLFLTDSGGVPDSIQEIDMIELPPAAGATALV